MFDTVIISGGNIDRDFALVFLKEIQKENIKQNRNDKIRYIAVDRGLDFFAEINIVPDIAIGDFDSVSKFGKQYLSRHSEIKTIRLKPEKDDSDTQSACKFAFEEGAEKVLILGATGSRLDHVLANLGLLIYAKECKKKVVLADSNNYIELVESGRKLYKSKQYGTYVSFFSLGADVENLSLYGFKYSLRNYHLQPVDCGLTVSNEMQDECCKIEYTSGNLLMIQSRD